MSSWAFPFFFTWLLISWCRPSGFVNANSTKRNITVAVVYSKTDNTTVGEITDNLISFDKLAHQAVDIVNRDVNNEIFPGMLISLGPRMLSKYPNPMDVYNETCEKLNGTDVSAIVVTAPEGTTISLSVAGGFLGIPVIGLGTRSFTFSNKVSALSGWNNVNQLQYTLGVTFKL